VKSRFGGARQLRTALMALHVGGLALASASARSQQQPLDPAAWPWSSIGRVNVITGAGSRSQCTGTLIGRRHVLTAAHCLFNRTRRVWVPPSSVHFVAGYAQGAFKAHAQAAAYITGPGFTFTDPIQPAAAAEDWAVIALAVPIDLKPVPIQPRPLPIAPTHVMRAGYRGDRAHVLSVQQDCSVKAVHRPAPLLLHGCGSVHGESGSALLSVEGGGPQIIGVLVAGSRQESAAPSIAVPSGTFAAAAETALREP
jgi:protease YdgD